VPRSTPGRRADRNRRPCEHFIEHSDAKGKSARCTDPVRIDKRNRGPGRGTKGNYSVCDTDLSTKALTLFLDSVPWLYSYSMRKDKTNALKMRRSGKSYNEIVAALRIPKSTLSGWFANIDWSRELKQRLQKDRQSDHIIRLQELNKLRGANLARAYEEARAEAKTEFDLLKYNPLFIAGVMLYWGEGDKLTKYAVTITNSDPTLIRLYVFFLENICRIPTEKIKAHILIYPDLNEETCRLFWASRSHISLSRFMKCTVIQGKQKARPLKYGVCMVVISSTYLKVKMLEWLKLLPGELMNKAYYAKI